MGDDLAAANVNRSYSLAATSIAIFTFMLILSATVTATRYAGCDQAANIWFQSELTHTPPNSGTYLFSRGVKNPYTNPGCANVTYCELQEIFTTTQPGFWQLTSWAWFSASPDGSPWQFGTKGYGWTINGPGGPYRPAQ